jgi:predicted RNA-binding Zn ribbon-like protein
MRSITGQVNFTSHVDAVVAVAVALVNELTPGEARGREYPAPAQASLASVATAALRAGGRNGRNVTADEAAELAAAAQQLRAVFEAVAAGDVDLAAAQVNELLAKTGARPQLDRHDGEPWHLHFHGSSDALARGWAAGCATGLAVVLGTEQAGRLGLCTAARCDRVYVDTSRNGTRRFCSKSCQNRVKAAAFRARQPASEPG